jgi:hypothetical protein
VITISDPALTRVIIHVDVSVITPVSSVNQIAAQINE